VYRPIGSEEADAYPLRSVMAMIMATAILLGYGSLRPDQVGDHPRTRDIGREYAAVLYKRSSIFGTDLLSRRRCRPLRQRCPGKPVLHRIILIRM